MERRGKQKSYRASQDRCFIVVVNRQKDLPIESSSVKKIVSFLCKEKRVSKQVVVHLVSKKKICQLHAQFFNDPTPTDCISFPLDDDKFLGEIFVCPRVAKEYDPSHPHRETALYIIHSFLHLLGYDDTDPKNRHRMHREQNRLLKKSPCISETFS